MEAKGGGRRRGRDRKEEEIGRGIRGCVRERERDRGREG